MARFQTNPWDVDQLLAMMDQVKIVLPEFQRSFVWRAGDIDLLLTSLVQDYPAGSLLFLKAGPSAGLAWRPVEGVKVKDSRTPDYLVLDGQQRLTSLSYALNGRGEHLFFMDLRLLESDDLENGIYPLREAQARKQGLFNREKQFASHTYPVTAAMGVGADDYWFEDYVEYHVAHGGDRNELRARARKLKETFVDPLRRYRFPVVELPPETSLDAVCQIFETLNKTGMKLTVFDLLTAKFWPQEPRMNLRAMLDKAREEYPLLGREEFDVEPTFLLQAIALLRSGLCKRSDLLQLKRQGFENDWAKVCAAASASLAVLRAECGVLVRQWLPYAALFPALFAAATHVVERHGPAEGAAWDKLKRWFWCACFGQRYEGPVNTLNAADYRQLLAWLDDDNVLPEAVSAFSLDTVDLRRTVRQRNAVYRAVVCLTIVNGARDFHTGNRLTSDVLKDPSRRIEDHHLFPRAYLKRLSPPPSGENAILNRALIDYQTNRRISDRAPSVYVREIEDQLGAERLQEVLSSHLIPNDGYGQLAADDFDAFLAVRERLLVGAIASVTGAAVPDSAQREFYLDPARPFTNELALRRVLKGLRGRVFWYEQHMGAKTLELLAEEIDRETVQELRLLSGPAQITERVKRRYERFVDELAAAGVRVEWRVLPADVARDLHARILFDDDSAWELPPLNSLLKGAVDSIHPSAMPRARFEEAWEAPSATDLAAFTPSTERIQPRSAEAGGRGATAVHAEHEVEKPDTAPTVMDPRPAAPTDAGGERPRRARPDEILPSAEYYLPILETLAQHGGSATREQLLADVGERLRGHLLPMDYEQTPKHHSIRWRARCAFIMDAMKRGGLLTTLGRGHWALTEAGWEAARAQSVPDFPGKR